MTIARKLWLGFGGLTLLFLLAGLVIFFSARSIRSASEEMARVEEPIRAASYEMEINTAEMSRDVLEYLDTGDLQYRERFADDRADFEKFKARYDELVDTRRGREQGARIESIYGEYVALGERLMDRRDETGGLNGSIREDLQRFEELETDLDHLLDEEVQPWASQQLAEAEEDAADAIRNVYITIVVLILAGLLASILAATLISRGIIGSVHKLREGARRIGRGEMDHRVELNTADELGAVAAAFNEMLDRLGYRADVAANGLEAVEALSRTPYAAVLMDVQRPEMDGYEATAEIRKREEEARGRHTPIIAMTANAMEGDRERALEAGMDDYVPKPVKPEELDAVLGRWISQELWENRSTASGDGSPAAGQDTTENGVEDPLDPDVLAGLRDLGDSDLLSELAGMFLDDASSRLATLHEAVEGDDARSVKQTAHTLKGSSGNMGAKRMAEICAELQEVGASGDLARAPGLLEELEAEFGRVRPVLEAEVAKERSS